MSRPQRLSASALRCQSFMFERLKDSFVCSGCGRLQGQACWPRCKGGTPIPGELLLEQAPALAQMAVWGDVEGFGLVCRDDQLIDPATGEQP